MDRLPSLVLGLVAALGPAVAAAEAPGAPSGAADWPFPVQAVHRPGTYCWIPGSAFTETDIDWTLGQLKAAGIGTAHLIPIYGAKGAEDRYIPYLSPRWMAMLDHAVRRGRELGVQVDMSTGTGWCFGGPDLPADAIDVRARWDEKKRELAMSPAMKVKRPAPGGEGPMINPFSPRAMRAYLERFSRAFDESKAARPRAQYHDSFEYGGDWCPELPDAFRARCGYDLRDHLPAFFGAAPADADRLARVKRDYRATLAGLHAETMQAWAGWARDRGMLTRNEAHGSPANLLDVYALADIPETEMFGAPDYPVPGFRRDPAMVREGDSDPRIARMAASAAHVAHPPGRQLVASESCTWLREHWHTSLAHVKLELDDFFLVGVNHLFFHGTCFSPKDAPWPGWFFYASTQFNDRNAFWRDLRFLCDYAARCQSVLQAGEPGSDVLLYWPIDDLWSDPKGTAVRLTVHGSDWMAGQRVGAVASALDAKGWAYDFASDRMLESLRVEGGRLKAPGGTYRALAVPACRHMPDDTLRRLADLAAAGATVVFEKALPPDVPGLADLEARRARLAAERNRLEGAKTAVVADDAVAGLARAGVPREAGLAAAGLRFIRRRVDGDTWYFVANQGAKPHDGWVALAAPCAAATRHDPLTGAAGALAVRDADGGGAVYLQLEPGGSAIFRARAAAGDGPPWADLAPAGDPAPLAGAWSVEFLEGGPERPAPFTQETLTSWTRTPDPKAQAFAGTARYALAFERPAGAADEWILDLGDVRESARVRLNGQDAGALFCLPFRARVGRLLVPGRNALEVEVTGLSANRIRDLERRKAPWRIMRDINIVNVHYKPFEPDTWPVEDSGLLGPVTLRPMKRLNPAR